MQGQNNLMSLKTGEQRLRPVDDAWRKEVLNQVDDDIRKISQIITDGETVGKSDEFLSLFKSQKGWFDEKVTSTQHFFDASYNAVMQKKEVISTLVDCQKRAEYVLEDLIGDQSLDDKDRKKIKLLMLYDLNAIMFDNIKKGRFGEYNLGMPEYKIQDVTRSIFEKFMQYQLITDDSIKTATRKLEKDVGTFKKQLSDKKTGGEEDVTKSAEGHRRAKLDLELMLETTKNNLERLQDQEETLKQKVENHTRSEVENKFKGIIEQKNKQNLDLELRLVSLQKDLESLTKEINLWESRAKQTEQTAKRDKKDMSIRFEQERKKMLQEQLESERRVQGMMAQMKELEASLEKREEIREKRKERRQDEKEESEE